MRMPLPAADGSHGRSAQPAHRALLPHEPGKLHGEKMRPTHTTGGCKIIRTRIADFFKYASNPTYSHDLNMRSPRIYR
jgi:hypothetical protein